MADKFVSPEPPPTAHEAEILDILIEECAEVIQRATKMKRFGVREVQPGQALDNAERLSHEIGDVKALIDLALGADLADENEISKGYCMKIGQLERFMQTVPNS